MLTAQYRDITIDDVGFVKRKTKWGMWEGIGKGSGQLAAGSGQNATRN
jgi:hypothetical protein